MDNKTDMEKDIERVKTLTDDQLKSQLITNDYASRFFKGQCLEELLRRNTELAIRVAHDGLY